MRLSAYKCKILWFCCFIRCQFILCGLESTIVFDKVFCPLILCLSRIFLTYYYGGKRFLYTYCTVDLLNYHLNYLLAKILILTSFWEKLIIRHVGNGWKLRSLSFLVGTGSNASSVFFPHWCLNECDTNRCYCRCLQCNPASTFRPSCKFCHHFQLSKTVSYIHPVLNIYLVYICLKTLLFWWYQKLCNSPCPDLLRFFSDSLYLLVTGITPLHTKAFISESFRE